MFAMEAESMRACGGMVRVLGVGGSWRETNDVGSVDAA
jgi:hypothetical protein